MHHRQRIAAVVALAGILTGSLAVTTHAFDPEYVDHPLGVVEHNEQEGVLELGARWLRVPVEWRHIEPTDDDFNYQSGFSFWLIEAERLGMNLSPVLSIGQLWANGFPDGSPEWPSHPPSDLQLDFDPGYGYSETYYDFIFRFCEFFRGRIDRITIENEVNTNVFWAGTMDEYDRVLATAAKAVEDVAPEILVFDSGLGSGSWGVAVAQSMMESGRHSNQEILDFVNAYYEHDLLAPLHFSDFQSFNYWIRQPFVQENISRVEYTLATVPDHVDGLNFKFTESHWLLPPLIDWIDERLALGGHAIPLKVNNEASNWPLGGQVLEGRNLFKMIITGLSKGVAQHLWFPYSNQTTQTLRLGLLDDAGVPTKQADALLNLSRRLGADHHFLVHDTLGTNVMRFRFLEEGEAEPRLDAMWFDDGDHGTGAETVDIPLPTGTQLVLRFDYDGSLQEIPTPDDTLTTSINHSGYFYLYLQTATDVEDAPPAISYNLLQNTPNPFRPETSIRYLIPGEGSEAVAFTMEVFDAGGRRVRVLGTGTALPGWHTAVWDGNDDRGRSVPAGSYWYRLVTPEGTSTRRMLRLR